MSIDLTKPIFVGHDSLDECGSHYYIHDKPPHRSRDTDETEEAYRQLFEEAPRTKREHGEMLAWMKKVTDCELGPVADEGRALIAEIEA